MLEVSEGPRRGGTLCWTILTSTKELARNAKSGSKLITIITEFRILRRIKKAKSRITNLDLRRADFSMFRDQLGRIL